MVNRLTDTIAAIATPPGKGGVALIRISGPEAIAIADLCFVPSSGKLLSAFPARHAVYGHIVRDGEPIDDGMAVLFHAPASFTGEDTVELSCHGGVLVTRAVLETVFAAGAVCAAPGEFTRRAYLSGKLTLTDAEAIGTLLDADSDSAVRLCASDARARLREATGQLRAELVHLLASLYAAIDYPDEDLAELDDRQIAQGIEDLKIRVRRLADSYRTGSAMTDGITTVLCGSPNAGKSTLYNALCGEDAAIVTDIPGTTRDLLDRRVTLDGITLHLWDTAGLRDTGDPIEAIGVSRTRKKIADAQLVLALFDGGREPDKQDNELITQLQGHPGCVIAVVTKSDLGTVPLEALRTRLPHTVAVNALQNDLSELTALIRQLFIDETLRIGTDAIVSTARQNAALHRCLAHLEKASEAHADSLPQDLVSGELELALNAVCEIDGKEVNEEVVSEIFSRFCVGK